MPARISSPRRDTLSSKANWNVAEPSHSPSPLYCWWRNGGIWAPRQLQAVLWAPTNSLPRSLRLSPALPPLPTPQGFKQLNSAAQNGAGREGGVSIKKGPAVLTPLRNLHILWGTMLLQTLLLSLSCKTCTLTCAVICSWNCWDLISTLHPCSWEIIYFSPLGRNSIACKAISVCLKEENKPMILPSSRPSGDRPQPWPAAPVQLAVKLKSLPAHHKARGARGTVFQPPGILLYSFQARSLPQPWSERKSRGNGAQHPEVGSPPAYKERLTPSAPAGSPPQRLQPQGRLAGRPSSKGLRLQDWPHPAPQAFASPHWQALRRGRLACTTALSVVPSSGRTAKGRPATHPPQFLAFPGRPPLLLPYLSVFSSSTSTQTASHERRPLSIFPCSQQVPEAALLTERYLHHCAKARFLPFAPHAAVQKPCCLQSRPRSAQSMRSAISRHVRS